MFDWENHEISFRLCDLKSFWHFQMRCLEVVGFMGLKHRRDILIGDIDVSHLSLVEAMAEGRTSPKDYPV